MTSWRVHKSFRNLEFGRDCSTLVNIMCSVYYKLINSWPTESGEVPFEPNRKCSLLYLKMEVREVTHIKFTQHADLSTSFPPEPLIASSQYKGIQLPAIGDVGGCAVKPFKIGCEEGKLSSTKQKNIMCSLSQEIHLSFLVVFIPIKKHSRHMICHFDLAGTFLSKVEGYRVMLRLQDPSNKAELPQRP